jgi:choline monooxygenase
MGAGLSQESLSVLSQLKHHAELPFSRARTAPPALYNLPEIHALEIDRIFRRDWVCAGLAATIPSTGDYLTFSIAAQPVVVLRSSDGQVRAFSNVCLHRMMILLEGSGSVERISCPYHAWAYDLEGRLVGAGNMNRTEGFDRQCMRLPEIRAEIWHGWIYLTLNPDAPAVAELLSPIAPVVEPYHMAGYVPILHEDHVWQTNWKLVTENFTENYHGPIVHASTVAVGAPVMGTEFVDAVHDAFCYSTFPRSKPLHYGLAHPGNTSLEGKWRYTTVLLKVFPTHLVSIAPDLFWYLSVRPQGAGEVQVRFGAALAPERYAALDDRDAFIGTLEAFFRQVNSEDRTVVEGIYRGSHAPLAASGPFSWLEREVHDFMRYLSRRLTSDIG